MRINKIVEMIKGGNTLLDIGTDHGKVIIEAFKKGYIKKAIATDINKGPLKRAEKNIINEGLLNKVTFIQTNGFKDIKLDYDVVTLTGLGFKTAKSILMMPHKKPQFYVFGIQSEIEEFRQFLSNNGYKIIDEEIVNDKKIYIFIKAIFKNDKLSEKDVILGPFLKHKKEAISYYLTKISDLREKTRHKKGRDLEKINKKINIYLEAINKFV